jgi:hypothetical protein
MTDEHHEATGHLDSPPLPARYRRLALHRLYWPHWAAIGLILAMAAGCLMAGADKVALVEAAAAVGYLLIWLFRPFARPR